MRVLVINQHYWPETAATGQLLADVCEDLASKGHEVTVLCGQPSYRQTDGPAQLAREEVHRGVTIRRLWNYAPVQRTFGRRIAHYSSFFANALVESLRRSRPDVLLVLSTPPLLLGLAGELQRLLRGVPFVYSVQDLYPDIAINLGVLRPGWLTSVIDEASKRLYRQATHLVTLSEAMAARLVEKGVAANRISVIPNWADTRALQVIPRDNAYSRANGLNGTFVLQYSGNIGMSQGLEFLPAVAELVADLPVTFTLVGGGNARAGIEADAKRRGLTQLRFFPPEPRERLGELLGACDVGLVTMRRGVGSDLVPSKLYGIMASGRPVLAAVEANSEVARVLNRFSCGVRVAPEDPEAMAEGIRRLVAAPVAELAAMGRAGRMAAEEHFSRNVCTKQYEKVLVAQRS